VPILKSAADHPLSARLILAGLLGAPIAHSASPAMHERAAEAIGLRCHYQFIEVAGAAIMTGRDLAIYQAADAFELFTGLKPSATEIGNAFDDVMAKRYAASHAA
jgi:shikimate 5-dehydrogenase